MGLKEGDYVVLDERTKKQRESEPFPTYTPGHFTVFEVVKVMKKTALIRMKLFVNAYGAHGEITVREDALETYKRSTDRLMRIEGWNVRKLREAATDAIKRVQVVSGLIVEAERRVHDSADWPRERSFGERTRLNAERVLSDARELAQLTSLENYVVCSSRGDVMQAVREITTELKARFGTGVNS